MKQPKHLLSATLFLLSFIFISCVDAEKDETSELNKNLTEELGIDVSDVLYQRFQKFGFTDVCEDIRIISKLSTSPELANQLPMTMEDLTKFNSTPNKVDTLNGLSITTSAVPRDFYLDIELEYVNFVSDSNLTVQLEFGEYELKELAFGRQLTIFDSRNGLLYIELHRCDGN